MFVLYIPGRVADGIATFFQRVDDHLDQPTGLVIIEVEALGRVRCGLFEILVVPRRFVHRRAPSLVSEPSEHGVLPVRSIHAANVALRTVAASIGGASGIRPSRRLQRFTSRPSPASRAASR